MPGGNRRGPANKGPMTGRGLGYCAGAEGPGSPRPGNGWGGGFGRGFRHGWSGGGRGRGWGWGGGYGYAPDAPVSRDEEIDFLKQEAAAMKEAMQEIDARLQQLATPDDTESSTS
ncbi:DUF5320 domain-containing protein [bacterium]|nr:DUF5320 domain-containing protein [bacterium]